MTLWLQIILGVLGTLGTMLLGIIANGVKNIADKQNILTTKQDVIEERIIHILSDLTDIKDWKNGILTGQLPFPHQYTKRHD